jgi:galactokinase
MKPLLPSPNSLAQLYGKESRVIERQSRRWRQLREEFDNRFGDADVQFFSAPGRTEIGGNHTDHNHGKVLAAAIDLDAIAVASPFEDNRILVHSEGFDRPFEVSLEDLSAAATERGTTAALIRGIASRYRQLGYSIGGFRACVASDVPVGSGLSSSAAIEVLIATILNQFYNGAGVDKLQVALIGQYAENEYFGKPCGLMDQIACVMGGIVKIDFLDPGSPAVEKIDFDFTQAGYRLMVVDTGGNHADLTEEYASIPREMRAVAAFFGRRVCRDLSLNEILGHLPELRAAAGDRAILRSLHFLQENQRVDHLEEALRNRDMMEFLRLIDESGKSSFRWLQNCLVPGAGREQGIALALALAQEFIAGGEGATRVHGGGFAGTIQVFLPTEREMKFQTLAESVFGRGCVKTLRVRGLGSLAVR